MPATVSPAPKSNSPSSPVFTPPSPSNNNSPPKFFSANFPPRNPSASLAVKTSPPSANGPAPAPSPPTRQHNPHLNFPLTSFILLRKIFSGELHESQTLPASHRLFPAVRNATLRPNSPSRNSSSQSPLQLQRPRSCPGQTRAHGFRSQ